MAAVFTNVGVFFTLVRLFGITATDTLAAIWLLAKTEGVV
jgi:hypothetical protein